MNSFLPPLSGPELLETCALCRRLHAPLDVQVTHPVCADCLVALRQGPPPGLRRLAPLGPPRTGLPRRRRA